MRVQILRNTVADGDIVRAGQIVSLRYETAIELIQIKKAVAYEGKEPLVNRAEELDMEKPKLQKRRGRPRLSDKK